MADDPKGPVKSTSQVFAKKYCFRCGVEIFLDAEICPKCGVRQPLMSKVSGSGKNKLVAALLAIFFGGIGLHKFYLGKGNLGALYLILTIFLSWTIIVPTVVIFVSFLEGLSYLSLSDEDFSTKYGN